MATRHQYMKEMKQWGSSLLVIAGFTVGVVLALMWLAGWFQPKVSDHVPPAESHRTVAAADTVPVRRISLPLEESAVGTIRAVHETSIGSKLLARVTEVNLTAGKKVSKGDVLVRLDDSDMQARLEQAKASVQSLEAVYNQAVADEKRYANLISTNAISRQEYERAVTKMRSSEADLLRAKENVNEIQAMLDWATIRSPIDGTIVDKKVDVGDMVSPGQILLTLYDPTRMQLVASVRESLAHRLNVGQQIGVQIDGLNKQCSGTISEIVPEAQSASRSFQVKVTGPCPTGIYSGMFGRLQIPLDEEQILVIPAAAVRPIGQLELVEVVEDGKPIDRAIRTGRTIGAGVEVLSGLREGESVVLPGNAPASQPGATRPVSPADKQEVTP